MPEIAVDPFLMQDAILNFALDDYAAAVSSATLTPTAANVTWKGLKPAAVFTFAAAATWTLDLEYAQDWETANSLAQYLYLHEGETIAATLTPQDGLGQAWAVNVIITPGAVGGAVDTVAVGSVSLGVKGRPVASDVA